MLIDNGVEHILGEAAGKVPVLSIILDIVEDCAELAEEKIY